jgi:hypothetical protein
LAVGGGGHLGLFLDRNITARLEVGYEQLNGSGSPAGAAPASGGLGGTATTAANLSLQYAFINMDLMAGYWIEAFELSAGVSYAYGVSLTDLPNGGHVDGAADLSNLGVLAAVGYKVSLSDLSDLIFRAKYRYSFLTSPLNFQSISLYLCLVFHG